MIEDFLEATNTKEINASEYSPLNLAYIGDAVFEIFVRNKLLESGNAHVNKLHKRATKYVKAEAQSVMYHKLTEVLTEEEMAVLKRGRNAKSFTKAKNASVVAYRHATGVEALFGYLFIKGEVDRLSELFKICIEE